MLVRTIHCQWLDGSHRELWTDSSRRRVIAHVAGCLSLDRILSERAQGESTMAPQIPLGSFVTGQMVQRHDGPLQNVPTTPMPIVEVRT